MSEKKDLKKLETIAKKIVSKTTWKKIKEVKDREEKIDVLKYAIGFHLELRLNNLQERIDKMKREKKDIFIVATNASLLRSKVKLFEATFEKKDFDKVWHLITEIERNS